MVIFLDIEFDTIRKKIKSLLTSILSSYGGEEETPSPLMGSTRAGHEG